MRSLALIIAGCMLYGTAHADFIDRTCLGNLETYDQRIIKAGLSLKLSYRVTGTTAQVRFAGREFNAKAERGNSWQGHWIKRMDDEIYFSYLPTEGGNIKYQFKPNEWFSGKC
jgi:hypothetical protein